MAYLAQPFLRYLITISAGFALQRSVGNFWAGNSAMAAIALFSNSDTCQVMPQIPLGSCLHCSRCILVKCPKSGPWVVAQQLGQLPLWIHEPIWAAAYILCMILAAIGAYSTSSRGPASLWNIPRQSYSISRAPARSSRV